MGWRVFSSRWRVEFARHHAPDIQGTYDLDGEALEVGARPDGARGARALRGGDPLVVGRLRRPRRRRVGRRAGRVRRPRAPATARPSAACSCGTRTATMARSGSSTCRRTCARPNPSSYPTTATTPPRRPTRRRSLRPQQCKLPTTPSIPTHRGRRARGSRGGGGALRRDGVRPCCGARGRRGVAPDHRALLFELQRVGGRLHRQRLVGRRLLRARRAPGAAHGAMERTTTKVGGRHRPAGRRGHLRVAGSADGALAGDLRDGLTGWTLHNRTWTSCRSTDRCPTRGTRRGRPTSAATRRRAPSAKGRPLRGRSSRCATSFAAAAAPGRAGGGGDGEVLSEWRRRRRRRCRRGHSSTARTRPRTPATTAMISRRRTTPPASTGARASRSYPLGARRRFWSRTRP